MVRDPAHVGFIAQIPLPNRDFPARFLEEVHFHILDEGSILTMCERCWAKGPLPEDDRNLGAMDND